MPDNNFDCKCGHTRRGHFAASGRLRDVSACKTKECPCRNYVGKPLTASPRELDA